MKRRTSPLDNVNVAAPCPADWEGMNGTEKVRFCALCNLNVYNLSGMTKAEAERLIVRSEGSLCVRYYRRADGTILTRNCPVGLRALKKRLTRMASALASLILSFMAGLLAFAGLQKISPATNYGNRFEMGTISSQPAGKRIETIEEKGEIIKPEVTVTTGTYIIQPEEGDKGQRARRHR